MSFIKIYFYEDMIIVIARMDLRYYWLLKMTK